MAPNDSEFWNALQASDLLTVTQRKWIKKERFSGQQPADAGSGNDSDLQTLSQLLISKGWLTEFQTRLLETYAQHPTRIKPFTYGPFQLKQDLQPPQFVFPNQFQGCLTTEHADQSFANASFIVRFLSYSDPELWKHLKKSVRPSTRPHLIDPLACVQLPDYRAMIELDFTSSLRSLPSVLLENLNQQKSLSSIQVLRVIGGVAAALSSIHQEQQVCGLVTPAMIFLDDSDTGHLRSIGDLFLHNSNFAKQVWGIKEKAEDQNFARPIVVTQTDRPKRDSAGDDWKSELLKPLLADQTSRWSDADFLAPELFLGNQATPASDLYSLGCLLYFIAIGRVPFAGETWVAKHLSRKQLPDIPDDVAKPIRKLLEHLLEPDPVKRQLSAQKLSQSIWALLKAEPHQSFPCNTPDIANAIQWLELQDARIFPETSDDHPLQVLPSSESIAIPSIVPVVATDAKISIDSPANVPRRRWEESQKTNTVPIWIGGSITAILALVGIIWASGFLGSSAEKQIAENLNTPVATEPATETDVSLDNEEAFDPAAGWTQKVVKDDGKLLWESPTTGLPVQLNNLPSNPYGLCIVRREFWENAPAEQLLAAIIGIKNASARQSIHADLTNLHIREFEQTILAQYQQQNKPYHLMRCSHSTGIPITFAAWKIVGQLPTEENSENNSQNSPQEIATASDEKNKSESPDVNQVAENSGQKLIRLVLVRSLFDKTQVAVIRTNEFDADLIQSLPTLPIDRLQIEMFDPETADQNWPDQAASVYQLTLCDSQLAVNAIKATGPTQLTLPMSAALDCSDEDRHLQLVIDPVSVWNEAGRTFLGEDRQWLADLVKTKVPLQTRSIYLSAHFDGLCYLESKFVIDRTQDPAAYLRDIRSKLVDAAPQVEKMILAVPRMEFWDAGLIQFDDMLTALNESLRTGQHNRIPTMNSWLPLPAAVNLLAETDLFFTATKYSNAISTQQTVVDKGPQTLDELLQTKRTVKIPEQDLVNALVDMQTEIKAAYSNLPFDFEIELDGNSLQLDGITQNQKITDFHQVDQPLADILAALVLKATTDKSASSAKDPKCKLTWLPHPNKPGTILVTTRSNVEKNNWQLPPQTSIE